MSELMEDRGHIIKAQQGGLTRGRLGKVGNIEDHCFGSQQTALIHKAVFPGATALIRSREVVAVIKRQRFAVSIEDFKDAHIGLIDRNVLSLFEGDAVELIRGKENAS